MAGMGELARQNDLMLQTTELATIGSTPTAWYCRNQGHHHYSLFKVFAELIEDLPRNVGAAAAHYLCGY